jgi:hypothetical protein
MSDDGNTKWRLAMHSLDPLITGEARTFASNCGDLDNTAFEDAAYW